MITTQTGQNLRGQLFRTGRLISDDGPTIIRAEAYPGQPYGVGKVTFRIGQADKLIQYTGAVTIGDTENRLLYPAFSDGFLSLILNQPQAMGGLQTVWFLFRGDQPLNLTLQAGKSTSTQVPVNARRRQLGRIVFQQWWRQFNAHSRARTASGDYPPLVESYLTSMLARRLNLPIPLLDRLSEHTSGQFQQMFNLMFDVESIRAESIRQLMTEPPQAGLASIPLPPDYVWPASWLATDSSQVAPESIAAHVPEECFYLRFGNWDNQLWLKRLMEDYGGDLSRMIQLRGHRSADTSKLLDQLVLESGQLDEWFGGNLIADVAVIGTDLYIEDGPSMGIILQAKNDSLTGNITGRRQRFARINREAGVTLKEIEIAGHRVSLLSAPDNHIRSYYAVDEDSHLVTTSRTIVERFFEAGHGIRSLAVNTEFLRVRQIMPLERDDTVFVYLSRQFFQNLLSPRYQIELARRNRSLANTQLLQLAQMAAANEGIASDSIEQMIVHGLLPQNFNQLPDGSQNGYTGKHWQDSIRGRRGYFTPISDVQIDLITPAESAWLEERLSYYAQQLQQVDPIVVGIKRFELDDNVERVIFDARVSPMGSPAYGFLSRFLGPAMSQEIVPGNDDLISIQASLAGLPVFSDGQPFQVFAAVQGDVPPKTDLRPANVWELFQLLKTTPGYLVAWPKPGFLDMFPALGGQPDQQGYTYSRILDLWRLQHGEFSFVSFDRNRLEAARHQLKVIPAEQPAQVRLRVGDIANSNLKTWANVMFYQRGWETSVANIRLINAMIQQFRLDPDTALARAEDLLGVDLVCPLGGEYRLIQSPSGQITWQSTKWPVFDSPMVPNDYEAPPMTWFRGMKFDVYQLQTQLIAHGSLDIQRKSSIGGFPQLPAFNLFNGFSKVEELPEALGTRDDKSSGELSPPPNPDQRDKN